MVDEVRAAQLKRLVIANELSRHAGGHEALPESAVPPNAPMPDAGGVIDRADALIQKKRCDQTPLVERDKARDILRKHALAALDTLASGGFQISADQTMALEALIIADGTRPSFLLQDGKPDLADPTMGNWANIVAAHWRPMQTVAQAVGRIQPRNGSASSYIGTGTLINRDAMLVLTNYHVIRDARDDFDVAMSTADRTLKVEGDLFIDFLGEASSLEQNLFRIVEVTLPEGYGAGFGAIDAAIARVVPGDGAVLPEAVPLLSSAANYANGGMSSLVTVGYPGPPPQSIGTQGTIDWTYVNQTLFGNKFGFKRLAPGTFTSARGSNPADVKRTAFGHNATTFGGASGSLVAAWADTGAPSFGLHFAGQTGIENSALAFAIVADMLKAVGVRFA